MPARPLHRAKLQLPPELVAKTLIEFAEAGDSAPGADSSSELPVFCRELTADVADPLLRLIRSFDDPADCRMLASSCLREICYRLLRSDAASMLRASVTREDIKLVAAMRFIEDNAENNLTVVDKIRQPQHARRRRVELEVDVVSGQGAALSLFVVLTGLPRIARSGPTAASLAPLCSGGPSILLDR